MSFLHLRGLGRWLATPVDQPAGIQVVHTVAPPVLSAAERDAARVADIDRRLAEIAEVPAPVREWWMWWRADRLLELRNAVCPQPPLPDDYAVQPRPLRVRPSVPVVPGRTS